MRSTKKRKVTTVRTNGMLGDSDGAGYLVPT
jgi:hypothetical protein